MEELHRIIKTLDSLPNYESRRDYLESTINDLTIDKYHLKKIACNVLLENNFIISYYREDKKVNLNKIISLLVRKIHKILYFIFR